MADSEAADAEADVGSPADSASRRDPIGAVFSAASSSSSPRVVPLGGVPRERGVVVVLVGSLLRFSAERLEGRGGESDARPRGSTHLVGERGDARDRRGERPRLGERGERGWVVLDDGFEHLEAPRDHLREARRRREGRERLVALRDDLHREARVTLLGEVVRERRDGSRGGEDAEDRGAQAEVRRRRAKARVREPERRDERRRAGEEAGLEDARRGVRRFRFVSSPRGDAHGFVRVGGFGGFGGGVAVVGVRGGEAAGGAREASRGPVARRRGDGRRGRVDARDRGGRAQERARRGRARPRDAPRD